MFIFETKFNKMAFLEFLIGCAVILVVVLVVGALGGRIGGSSSYSVTNNQNGRTSSNSVSFFT